MDLVFDLDVAAPASNPVGVPVARSAEAVVTLGRWYDWGYDGHVPTLVRSASTAELLAYWWGSQDARWGRARQDVD